MKLIKSTMYLSLVALLLGMVYYGVIFFSARDIENVECSGHVFDKSTKKPFAGATVVIYNDRYMSDRGVTNYDEFLGHDTAVVITNNEGHFYSKFKKSSFVWLTVKKKGYKTHDEKGVISEKELQYKIYLNQ